jgi:hypothetical protein
MWNVSQVWLILEVFGNCQGIQSVPQRFPNSNARPDVTVGKDGVGMRVEDESQILLGIRESDLSLLVSGWI